MGEKSGEKKAAEGGEKKVAAAAEGGGKKDEGAITAVLKLDLHCEGCAKKVKRAVSHFEGVEKVKADCAANKLSVTGNVDPAWLRERVEYKTKKKVELISPQPKKDGGGGGDKKADDKSDKKPDEKKADDKKPKEPAVSTVVMKIKLHCDGCAHKIKRVVSKNIDGVNSVKTDLQKDLVTVTGTMNVKELTSYLQEKLKKGIEIIPPKKDDGGGDNKKAEKEGGGGGGDKKDAGAGKESKPAGGGGEASKGGEGTKVEVKKLEYNSLNPQTHFAMPMYNQSYANQDYGVEGYANHGYYPNHGYPQTGYVVQYSQGPPPPPPTYLNVNDQMFSDENPNGCSVM
ncbi:heavy metal-associated isoprenylated plant protein 26 [Phtheirospermum japonicum]|uniref:Heavy metal-associated isoprenylated plant protein 26 n=1 Tax=Phtheirospermum japonicum TaxID=374723 RepID=A0A830CVS1_9LAMI|nr:heavy metal-associated isoprenylated plant protein 26 [Phtheirospermum japonicum]